MIICDDSSQKNSPCSSSLKNAMISDSFKHEAEYRKLYADQKTVASLQNLDLWT